MFSPSPKIFDKLPVIYAKLSVHMTGVDAAEKDWRLFDIWDRRFDKLPVISAKLSLCVTGADVSGKEDWPVVFEQAQLLRKLAPLQFLNWPLRILSSPLRSLKSRRVLIFIVILMMILPYIVYALTGQELWCRL
ncbi:hypothetical protein ACFX13_017862 [Malus domestica]